MERSGAFLEPSGLASGFDDFAVMSKPVEESGRHPCISEHSWPFAEREFGGDDDGGLFIELADKMQQELTA